MVTLVGSGDKPSRRLVYLQKVRNGAVVVVHYDSRLILHTVSGLLASHKAKKWAGNHGYDVAAKP